MIEAILLSAVCATHKIQLSGDYALVISNECGPIVTIDYDWQSQIYQHGREKEAACIFQKFAMSKLNSHDCRDDGTTIAATLELDEKLHISSYWSIGKELSFDEIPAKIKRKLPCLHGGYSPSGDCVDSQVDTL